MCTQHPAFQSCTKRIKRIKRIQVTFLETGPVDRHPQPPGRSEAVSELSSGVRRVFLLPGCSAPQRGKKNTLRATNEDPGRLVSPKGLLQCYSVAVTADPIKGTG